MRLAVFVLTLLVAPIGARASNFLYEAVAAAPSGSWAEYTMTIDGRSAGKQKMILVEKTPARLVLEIHTTLTSGIAVTHNEYVRDSAGNWAYTKGFVRLPNGTETPLASTPEDDFRIVKGVGLGERIGREQVVTPKGTIACTHWVKTTKMGVTHFWTDDRTFPVGLVKSTIEAKKMEVLLSAASDKR